MESSKQKKQCSGHEVTNVGVTEWIGRYRHFGKKCSTTGNESSEDLEY